jgi:hypothetical protein
VSGESRLAGAALAKGLSMPPMFKFAGASQLEQLDAGRDVTEVASLTSDEKGFVRHVMNSESEPLFVQLSSYVIEIIIVSG